VAAWTDPRLPADRAAALLRPAPPVPVRFVGAGVELRAAVAGKQPRGARVVVRIQPYGDPGPTEVPVDIRPGRVAYRIATPDCVPDGCRLLGLDVDGVDQRWYDVTLTLRGLRQTGPDADVVRAADRVDRRRWAQVDGDKLDLSGDAAGLRVRYAGTAGPEGTLVPLSTPRPVPLLAPRAPRPSSRSAAAPPRGGRPAGSTWSSAPAAGARWSTWSTPSTPDTCAGWQTHRRCGWPATPRRPP
jgi:hypothetical protein